MADKERESFQEFAGRMQFGELDEIEADEEVTPEESDEAQDTAGEPGEDAEVEDATLEDPDESEDEESEEEEEAPEEDESDDEDAGEAQPADEDTDEGDEDEPEAEPDEDDEEADLGRLRLEDYTRKTQELARQRQEMEQQRQQREALIDEMAEDEGMQEFLRDHPESLRYLVRNPEATKQLIGSPRALEEFRRDYEAISESPTLAKRFLDGDREQVQQAAQQRQLANTVVAIGEAMDQAISTVAENMGADEDAIREVQKYVQQIGGLPDEPDPQTAVQGFQRIYSVFFRQDGDGNVVIDPTLLQERFKSVTSSTKKKRQSKKSKAEEHNRSVDKKLKEKPDPATPSADGAPGAEPEDEYEPESFGGLLRDLTYGTNN